MQLAHDDGAVVLASAAGGRGFDHRGLGDGDEVDLGGLTLAALATPGHTDEHLSFLLRDGGRPARGVHRRVVDRRVGGPHRPARRRPRRGAGPRPVPLAAAAGRRCPRPTAVWPTHGAGSFCSAPPGAERTSTIGRELATNPLLRHRRRGPRSSTQLLGSLGSYPPYFLPPRRDQPARPGRARPRRRRPARPRCRCPRCAGCAPTARSWSTSARCPTTPPRTSPARCRSRCAPSSRPGWAGSSHADAPLVVVRDPDQDLDEIVWQALKIGYERLAGELAGGIDAWTAAGQPTASTELLTGRSRSTSAAGARRPPGHRVHRRAPARRRCTSSSARSPRPRTDLPERPTVVMCGHGERAAGAASLLERAGHRDLAVLAGGATRLGRATGRPLDDRPMARRRRPPGRRGWGCGRTWPSSACWSRSTRWSAGCSGRNARCCRCWPTTEFGLTALHRRADLHPRLRRHQGRHQLRRRHPVRPLRPQTRARRSAG